LNPAVNRQFFDFVRRWRWWSWPANDTWQRRWAIYDYQHPLRECR
jgi:hypothetical protein